MRRARISLFGPSIADGEEVTVAIGAQPRRHGRAANRLASARKGALLHRVKGISRLPQVVKEPKQILFVQQRKLDLHRARKELDIARLASYRRERALALDRITQVEELPLR